jgi:hypothetical protein
MVSAAIRRQIFDIAEFIFLLVLIAGAFARFPCQHTGTMNLSLTRYNNQQGRTCFCLY